MNILIVCKMMSDFPPRTRETNGTVVHGCVEDEVDSDVEEHGFKDNAFGVSLFHIRVRTPNFKRFLRVLCRIRSRPISSEKPSSATPTATVYSCWQPENFPVITSTVWSWLQLQCDWMSMMEVSALLWCLDLWILNKSFTLTWKILILSP